MELLTAGASGAVARQRPGDANTIDFYPVVKLFTPDAGCRLHLAALRDRSRRPGYRVRPLRPRRRLSGTRLRELVGDRRLARQARGFRWSATCIFKATK